MKITFLGATHEVTGSKTLLEACGKRFLIDCGMEQGADMFVTQDLPIEASGVDFVLLTHAHIDHSGNLPLLYKNGFQGKVYASEATYSLCKIMLMDSAHIQMSDAEWKNRKRKRSGEKDIEPVYTTDDAAGVLNLFAPVPYGKEISPCDGIRVRFNDAGHLLGSASIEVWMTEQGMMRKMVFSGDLGNLKRPIIRDPQTIAEADYVMIESTYGDRLHEHPADYVPLLADVISRTLDRGGNVVIPSFAVGRTQEILFYLRQIKEKNLIPAHPDFPVVVDSPLASEATNIFMHCDPAYFDDETRALIQKGVNPIRFPGLKTSVALEESKAINVDPEPKVILSASGMCEAGRIRHHLKHNLWRKESTVLFVGFQTEGTMGRILLDGAKTVKLFGESIVVNAEILPLPGVSGHADKNGLLAWLNAYDKKPSLVFVNHGEDAVCTSFASEVCAQGMEAVAPYSGTQYDLLTGECLLKTEGVPVERKTPQRTVNTSYAGLLASAERLLELVRRSEGIPNKEAESIAKRIDDLTDKVRR